MSDETLIQLTADIVSAYVSNNTAAPDKLPGLIEGVFAALTASGNPVVAEPAKLEPAVPIRASVKPDYIVCLEDGVKQTTLKRHLRTAHNMTPAEYRAKWGLPSDYPLVASNYSEKRRAISLSLGLGRKKSPPEPEVETPAAPKKRGRPKAAEVQQASEAPAPTPAPVAEEKPARKPRAKKAAPPAAE